MDLGVRMSQEQEPEGFPADVIVMIFAWVLAMLILGLAVSGALVL